MRYPAVLYNPQRPNAGFTYDSHGWYLTPTGELIHWEQLIECILSGTGNVSDVAVKEAQRLLGLTETGEIDEDTTAAVAQAQLDNGQLPTGIPTPETLTLLRSVRGNDKEDDSDNERDSITTYALLAVIATLALGNRRREG